ncbi:MAG TPA: roadblock/LC7 domain-containing protein [Polyangia bacterium]|jgi:predicted regulator of Ras-like GTPase activity (Roadblock/LC7/MglB family)
MSAFGDILREMVERVPGAVGAIFADWEGEAVDQFAHIPPLDIQLVGAHWGIVFNVAKRSLARVGAGAVEELWVEGERALVLVRRVTDRYYVVLATTPSAHLGTARRELERSAQTLLGEM